MQWGARCPYVAYIGGRRRVQVTGFRAPCLPEVTSVGVRSPLEVTGVWAGRARRVGDVARRGAGNRLGVDALSCVKIVRVLPPPPSTPRS